MITFWKTNSNKTAFVYVENAVNKGKGCVKSGMFCGYVRVIMYHLPEWWFWKVI